MKIRKGFVSNSSSSSFICDTDRPAEQIEKELRELLEIYNKLTNRAIPYEETFDNIYIGGKEDQDYLSSWDGDINVIGKTIINSKNDNSIPYELFDIIDTSYSARRIHLG